MFGILAIVVFGTWAIYHNATEESKTSTLPKKITDKLDKLWDIAQVSIQEKKYLRAEKALLTILRVDERNATAYNRLGILYARQKAFDDAIECFEIAQSLEPSSSSLHNVGLIYYETGSYEKAAIAFEQSISMENDLASRYIAYAKVLEQLDRTKDMVKALEKAADLEPVAQTLTILAEAYEKDDQIELAQSIRDKIMKMSAQQTARELTRPARRVIM